jgi:hypothetical protein
MNKRSGSKGLEYVFRAIFFPRTLFPDNSRYDSHFVKHFLSSGFIIITKFLDYAPTYIICIIHIYIYLLIAFLRID